MNRCIYWFRRDLRLRDNRSLSLAISRSDEVIPIYIVDITRDHRYRGGYIHPQFTLLLDALRELGKRFRLHVVVGRAEEVVDNLIDKYGVRTIYTSQPCTWSDEEEVETVRKLCLRKGVKFHQVLDNFLSNPLEIDPGPNFASFYKKWLKSIDIDTVGEPSTSKFKDIDEPDIHEFLEKHPELRSKKSDVWSISWGLSRLSEFNYAVYDTLRDYPYEDGTTRLSPYINLGIISIREIYSRAIGRSNELIRQLAWREYYYSLRYRYPWMRKLELKPQMRSIQWSNDKAFIEAFLRAKTGYPIVDAGIRQLLKENWVHNRVRLIIANFLVKDLHVDWRIGEKIFMEHLVDYDEVLNVGNWQWSASVGVDPLPLRVFNPVTQVKKYDPLCLYIKKYIPELENYDCKILSDPLRNRIPGYYEPIVNHYEQVERFREYLRKSPVKRN